MAYQTRLVIGEKFTPTTLINPSITLAHTPVGPIAVYAGAVGALSRLDTTKVAIVGSVVSMTLTITTGQVVVVDYQY